MYLVQLLILLAIGGVGAEYVLRKKGYSPGLRPSWMVEHDLRIEPDGRFFSEDSLLGWVHRAGVYTIHLSDAFSFTVTQREDQRRITRPLTEYDGHDDRPKIWFFGCSYTHGWSLDDDETFCWQLQQSLDGYEIVNYGGDGYGTLQSLLMLEKKLEEGPAPEAVVVAYAGFHDERNTFSRSWKKTLTCSNKMGPIPVPCARLDRNGNLKIKQTRLRYRKFPLMESSALVHLVERKFTGLLNRVYQNRRVTRAVIERMAELCERQETALAVAGIFPDASTREMLAWCEGQGLPTVDVSVEGDAAYNNLPHDPHPSAVANRLYAEQLDAFLRESVIPERITR